MAQSALSGPAGCWGGAGLLGCRDARLRNTRGPEGVPRPLLGGEWTRVKARITRGKYRTAAAAKSPRGDPGSPGDPWGGDHLLGTNPQGLSPGPPGESEGAVFWFQNEADKSVRWVPPLGEMGWGAQTQRGPLFSWQSARDVVCKAHSWGRRRLRHGGGGVGSRVSGCLLLRGPGRGLPKSTTFDACRSLPRPLPKTSSPWGFHFYTFHPPDNAARKVGEGWAW